MTLTLPFEPIRGLYETLFENEHFILIKSHDTLMRPSGLWLRKSPTSSLEECYHIQQSACLANDVADENNNIPLVKFTADLARCILHYGYTPFFAFMHLYDGIFGDFHDWNDTGAKHHWFYTCMADYRPLFITEFPDLMSHDDLKKWIIVCDKITNDFTVHEEMSKGAISFLHDALPVLDGEYNEAVWMGEIITKEEFVRRLTEIDDSDLFPDMGYSIY